MSWTESPGDRLVATLPSRAAVHRARLAFDGDGRFVALHADIVATSAHTRPTWALAGSR